MKIIRDNKLIVIDLKDVETGDKVICDNYEELVKVGRDLGYMGFVTQQREPMEITIVGVM